MKKYIPKITIILILVFGLMTLFLSTSIFLDLFDVRAKEGNYVLFIVWANFVTSIFYLFAVYGFIKNKSWTTKLLGITTIILLVAFVGLLIYINSGGIYETKTIGAMVFRIALTSMFTIVSYKFISQKSNQKI